MGAGQSQPSDRQPSRGLHILRVTPGSPASQTDLEPFFDFIIGLEDNPFSSDIDASELERIVESNEDKALNLLAWSSKTHQTRREWRVYGLRVASFCAYFFSKQVVSVTPSRIWSSQDTNGASSSQPSLLGLSMRLCEPEFALDNVWHVLDVLEGSPAESAGLVPYGDWIVGWNGGALNAEGDFYEVVEAHVDKPLRVYVYSYDFDTLREVVLVPNRQWGGEGLLGCIFGFGLLHRIPVTQPGQGPEELNSAHESLDEKEYEEQQLFVPADAHADTVFDTERTPDSPPWHRDPLPSPGGSVPALTLNGARVDGNSAALASTHQNHKSQMHEDGSDGDDEDDGRSLEETTGSITSVD